MGKMDMGKLLTEAVELYDKQLLPLPSQYAAIKCWHLTAGIVGICSSL